MRTYTITDNAGERILLRNDELNDSWILVSESKVTEKQRCATVLNSEEALKIAEIILKEGKK